MKTENQKMKNFKKKCKVYTKFYNQLNTNVLQAFHCKLRFTLVYS
jgi:hypothetical protein